MKYLLQYLKHSIEIVLLVEEHLRNPFDINDGRIKFDNQVKIYENTHITFTSDTFQNTLLIVTFKCTSEHYMTV